MMRPEEEEKAGEDAEAESDDSGSGGIAALFRCFCEEAKVS